MGGGKRDVGRVRESVVQVKKGAWEVQDILERVYERVRKNVTWVGESVQGFGMGQQGRVTMWEGVWELELGGMQDLGDDMWGTWISRVCRIVVHIGEDEAQVRENAWMTGMTQALKDWGWVHCGGGLLHTFPTNFWDQIVAKASTDPENIWDN